MLLVFRCLIIVEKPIENSEPIQETKIPFTYGKKMKRNEPCFCGSGKKYKKCLFNSSSSSF